MGMTGTRLPGIAAAPQYVDIPCAAQNNEDEYSSFTIILTLAKRVLPPYSIKRLHAPDLWGGRRNREQRTGRCRRVSVPQGEQTKPGKDVSKRAWPGATQGAPDGWKTVTEQSRPRTGANDLGRAQRKARLITYI
jgi:hypothetical protein